MVFCGSPRVTAQKKLDTIPVFFPFDISTLTSRQQHKLDSLAYREVLDFGRDLLIVGYADYVGRNAYNDTLSLKRARSVQDYLLTLGFRPGQVRLVIGKGKVEREGMKDNSGFAADRRVDIVLQDRSAAPSRPVRQQTTAAAAPPAKKQAAPTKAADYKPMPGKPPPRTGKIYEVTKNLNDILTVEVNETIKLDNLFFPPNSHFITYESKPELDRLLDIMLEHPSLHIRVEGHICCVKYYPDAWDEDEGDYHLSLNRARFIYNYLLENGVERDRMSYAGFGRSRPVAEPELTEEDTQRNRRVEVRVLAK